MTAPRTVSVTELPNDALLLPDDSNSLVTVEQSLLLACRKGNANEVEDQFTLLESKNPDISALTPLYTRACFTAVESNQLAVVEYFNKLPSFDLVEAKDDQGNSALHQAVKKGFEKLSFHLIEKCNLAPQSSNANKQNALHMAISGGHHNLVHALVEKYRLPLTTRAYFEEYYLTADALQLAVLAGDLDILLMLMRKTEPRELRIMATEGAHPVSGNLLHLAIAARQNAVLQHLLKDKDLVKDLLEQVNVLGMTPLALAAYIGNLEAIDQLHYEGAVFTAKNKNKNVLHCAILNGQLGAVDKVMKLASPEVRSRLLTDRVTVEWEGHDKPIASLDLPALYIGYLKDKNKNKQNAKVSYMIKSLNQIAGYLDTEDPIAAAKRNAPADFSDTPPENIIFQGGGPKGLAYLGALAELEARYGERVLWESVRRVAGTSAGAITAMLLAIGHKPEFVRDLLSDPNFLMQFVKDVDIKQVEALLKVDKSIIGKMMSGLSILRKSAMENASWWESLNPSKHAGRTYKTTGLCSGDAFRNWSDNIIAKKLADDFKGEEKDYKNFTFGDLKKLIQKGKPYKHLYVVATKIAPKPEIVIFNSEDDKYADVIIADAVRASMSIPLLFKPHARWIKYEGEPIAIPGEEYIDGGLLQNYTLKLFDKLRYQSLDLREYEKGFSQYNAKTLGFSIVEEKPADPKTPVKNLKELVESIAGIYWNGEQLLAELQEDSARTIAIPNVEGVNLTSFSISSDQQNELIVHGKEAVQKFFNTSPDSSVLKGQKKPAAGNGDSKQEAVHSFSQTVSRTGSPIYAGTTNTNQAAENNGGPAEIKKKL